MKTCAPQIVFASLTLLIAGCSKHPGVAAHSPSLIRLKSHSVVVAELRILAKEEVHVRGGTVNFDPATRVSSYKGGVTIQLGNSKDSPVTIEAEEAEMSPGAK